MLDIHDLERRWLRYKIKRYIPVGISILLILLLSIILIAIWSHTDKPAKTIVKTTVVSMPKGAKTVQTTYQTTLISNDNRPVLEPSMEFVQSFETHPQAIITPKVSNQQVTQPIQPQMKTIPPPQVIQVPTVNTPVVDSVPSEKSISINLHESKLDIEGIQRRFKETSNANLGLFIARYYYDQGNFNEAYNYALRTNTLNSKIDESWLIFSKSLVKLGKADQAKKTLQLYISQSNSETAKTLLDAINKGNFK